VGKVPTEGDIALLVNIASHGGVASSAEMGPQSSYPNLKARAHVRRYGWATFDGRGGYWRLTDLGWNILRDSPHGR
jgi:hypothetical protein